MAFNRQAFKIITVFLCLIFLSSPVFAYKMIGGEKDFPLKKVDVRDVFNAQEITIKYEHLLTKAFLSEIFCHEYTRSYTELSTQGVPYTRRYTRGVKKNSEPTKFLKDLVDNNPDNLYFKPKGIGLYNRFVGELFLGNTSVNKLMVEKGYCSLIQN